MANNLIDNQLIAAKIVLCLLKIARALYSTYFNNFAYFFRAPFSSAYVILGNLTVAQLLFVTACLPAIAYILLMELVTSEWLFGDIACRLVPFMTVRISCSYWLIVALKFF